MHVCISKKVKLEPRLRPTVASATREKNTHNEIRDVGGAFCVCTINYTFHVLSARTDRCGYVSKSVANCVRCEFVIPQIGLICELDNAHALVHSSPTLQHFMKYCMDARPLLVFGHQTTYCVQHIRTSTMSVLAGRGTVTFNCCSVRVRIARSFGSRRVLKQDSEKYTESRENFSSERV